MQIKLTAPLLLLAVMTGPALAQTSPSVVKPTALIHGNYCGTGNNAPLPPIDALDTSCARHDACTPNGALPSKACNLRLQREAEAVSRDPRQTSELRTMAGFVSVGASMMASKQQPTKSLAATSAAFDRSVAARQFGTMQVNTTED